MSKIKAGVSIILIIVLVAMVVGEIILFINQRAVMTETLANVQQVLTESQARTLMIAKEKKMLVNEKDALIIEKQKLIAEKEAMSAELTDATARMGELKELLGRTEGEKKDLQARVEQMTQESNVIKEQLRILEGKITDLTEVDRVNETRSKAVAELHQRVRQLKTKAQHELDQYRTKVGNHGFVVKEKQSTLIYDKLMEFERRIRRIDLKKIVVEK
ncbi:MAG: hypothetical protein WCG78_02770 [Candidatus Omnitrophota bacterium]